MGMGKETKVEVQKDGAWMEAVVVVAYGSGQGRRYKVRYDHHPNQDGQSLTKEEDVSFIRVRPIPPHTPHNNTYSIGDIVEVSDKGCWWQGVISKVMSTDSEFFLIYLLQNAIRKVYHCSKLRHAQEWLEGKWSRWPSQQTRNNIYEGKYPVAANSGISSVASSPWDSQDNAQSQRQFEEKEVKKKRRYYDRTQNRETLDVESNNVQANQRRHSLAPYSKGIKRVYIHDGRKDRMYRGIQDVPGNDVKRFKHTEPTKAMDQIQIGNLKYIETPAEICTRRGTLGSSSTELDNKTQRNNPLNAMAKQRLERHDRDLLAYHSVLEAFYAQSQGHLTWECVDLLTRLRLELHITNDEHTDKLKRLISHS